MFKSPKEELLEALLNTCSVSNEAKALLASMIEGSGGSGGGTLVISIEKIGAEQFQMDKTFTEIQTAMEAGKNVIVLIPDEADGYGNMKPGIGTVIYCSKPNEEIYFTERAVIFGSGDSVGRETSIFNAYDYNPYPSGNFT